MQMLRAIVFSAVLAGLGAGLFVSAIDMFGTTPLILAAEQYEQAGGSGGHQHSHGSGDEAAGAAHEEAGWAPADGLERTLYTTLANVLTAIGYSFVLVGIFSLRGKTVGPREGLLFGLAAFLSVMIAPSLGLPPELPGTPAGDLVARQIWWAATVFGTAGGLALLVFVREAWAAGLALLLFVAPHVYGAPMPPAGEHALAPEELSHRFIVVATITNLLLWAAIGALSAYFFDRFSKADD